MEEHFYPFIGQRYFWWSHTSHQVSEPPSQTNSLLAMQCTTCSNSEWLCKCQNRVTMPNMPSTSSKLGRATSWELCSFGNTRWQNVWHFWSCSLFAWTLQQSHFLERMSPNVFICFGSRRILPTAIIVFIANTSVNGKWIFLIGFFFIFLKFPI